MVFAGTHRSVLDPQFVDTNVKIDCRRSSFSIPASWTSSLRLILTVSRRPWRSGARGPPAAPDSTSAPSGPARRSVPSAPRPEPISRSETPASIPRPDDPRAELRSVAAILQTARHEFAHLNGLAQTEGWAGDAAAQSGLSQYELLTSLGDRFERRWR